MLRKALDAATPSLREIARQARVSYHAIRLYRAGIRTPAPKVLRRIALALRGQGEHLATLASELESAADLPKGRKP